MRVIGGTARGRQLRAPRSGTVRPTADRVREAIFDVLGHLGAVPDATVCDLFAGSGALGIEALSRGAARVDFVESDRAVAEELRANLERTGFAEHRGARVVRRDVFAFLSSATERFDVVLCDPPYAFDSWAKLLGLLDGELVVLESRSVLELPPSLVLHREYRYGTTLVTVARAVRGQLEAGRADDGPARGPSEAPDGVVEEDP